MQVRVDVRDGGRRVADPVVGGVAEELRDGGQRRDGDGGSEPPRHGSPPCLTDPSARRGNGEEDDRHEHRQHDGEVTLVRQARDDLDGHGHRGPDGEAGRGVLEEPAAARTHRTPDDGPGQHLGQEDGCDRHDGVSCRQTRAHGENDVDEHAECRDHAGQQVDPEVARAAGLSLRRDRGGRLRAAVGQSGHGVVHQAFLSSSCPSRSSWNGACRSIGLPGESARLLVSVTGQPRTAHPRRHPAGAEPVNAIT